MDLGPDWTDEKSQVLGKMKKVKRPREKGTVFCCCCCLFICLFGSHSWQALCSGIPHGEVQGFKWGARDQAKVDCIQGKHITCCIMALTFMGSLQF